MSQLTCPAVRRPSALIPQELSSDSGLVLLPDSTPDHSDTQSIQGSCLSAPPPYQAVNTVYGSSGAQSAQRYHQETSCSPNRFLNSGDIQAFSHASSTWHDAFQPSPPRRPPNSTSNLYLSAPLEDQFGTGPGLPQPGPSSSLSSSLTYYQRGPPLSPLEETRRWNEPSTAATLGRPPPIPPSFHHRALRRDGQCKSPAEIGRSASLYEWCVWNWHRDDRQDPSLD